MNNQHTHNKDTIITIKYGSHLYGTNTLTSDLDIKGVYLPTAHDILLQKVQPVITHNRTKQLGEKNSTEDVDYDLYSPAKFLHAIAKGQSFALEMLFAPDSAIIEINRPIWTNMKQFGMQLLTKQAATVVGYCKQQAYTYSQKGTYLKSAQLLLNLIIAAEKTYTHSTTLEKIKPELQLFVKNNPTLSFSSIIQQDNTITHYLDLCGKKLALNASLKNAHMITQNIINEYGDRAREAAGNQGADWKALSHAVRIAYQAIEFFTHHHLTFPRPEREHLLAIKNGEVPFDQVTQEIEQLLEKVELAAIHSTLPKTYDPVLIDTFIEKLYRQQVIATQA